MKLAGFFVSIAFIAAVAACSSSDSSSAKSGADCSSYCSKCESGHSYCASQCEKSSCIAEWGAFLSCTMSNNCSVAACSKEMNDYANCSIQPQDGGTGGSNSGGSGNGGNGNGGNGNGGNGNGGSGGTTGNVDCPNLCSKCSSGQPDCAQKCESYGNGGCSNAWNAVASCMLANNCSQSACNTQLSDFVSCISKDGGVGGQGGGGYGGYGGYGGSGYGGYGGSSYGGSGGSSGGCASGETCTDVSNGEGTTYACIPSSTSTMQKCVNGPYGLGCPSDQMCAEVTSLGGHFCLTKTGQVPAGATTCPNYNECQSTETCVDAGGTNYCLTTGCTAPTCAGGKLPLFESDANQQITSCVCAVECKP